MLKTHNPIEKALKLLAMLAINLPLYPIISFVFVMAIPNSEATTVLPLTLTALLLVELSCLIFGGIRLLMERYLARWPIFVIRSVRVLLMGAFGVAAFFLFDADILLRIFTGAAAAFAAFQGNRFVMERYSFITSKNFFIAEVGLHLIGAALIWGLSTLLPVRMARAPYSLFAITVELFVFFAIYAFSKNQLNIDDMLERRGYNSNSLPKKIRRFNLWLMALLIAVIGVCYGFKREIGKLFVFIFEMLRRFVLLVIDTVVWLIELTHIDVGEIGMDTSQGQHESMPMGDGASGFDWLTPIIVVLLLIHIIVKRRELLEWIRKQFTRALLRIKGFIQAAFSKKNIEAKIGGAVSEDYSDEVETLALEKKQKKKSQPKSVRKWKKEYRIYQKKEEGDQKLRYGFWLLQQGLGLRGIKLLPSATPFELLYYAREIFNEAQFPIAIEGYANVRYAELSAKEEERQAMEQSLIHLEKLL